MDEGEGREGRLSGVEGEENERKEEKWEEGDPTQLYLMFVVVFGSCMGSTDPPLTCRGKVERGASSVTLVPVCMTSEPYWEVCV